MTKFLKEKWWIVIVIILALIIIAYLHDLAALADWQRKKDTKSKACQVLEKVGRSCSIPSAPSLWILK